MKTGGGRQENSKQNRWKWEGRGKRKKRERKTSLKARNE